MIQLAGFKFKCGGLIDTHTHTYIYISKRLKRRGKERVNEIERDRLGGAHHERDVSLYREGVPNEVNRSLGVRIAAEQQQRTGLDGIMPL